MSQLKIIPIFSCFNGATCLQVFIFLFVLMDLTTPSSLTCQFVNFAPSSNTKLSNNANNIIMKSCTLDLLPATLLKQHFDLLSPIILKIVNLSLESSHFPSSLNTTVLSPLLKKANLDNEVLANYRPISNLKVTSKIIEKVVTVCLQKYLEANHLNEPLQSAYKPFHSCETALVHIRNDILVAIDKLHCVMLLLLDLSATFDTVHHDILFTRLHSKYSISGTALDSLLPY